MNQTDLFDGRTYDAPRDEERLTGQMADVMDIMRDGLWHTLGEIHALTGHSEGGISARIRDMRKIRWGCQEVESQFVRRGLWKYRLIR